MSRLGALLVATVGFAVLNTAMAATHFLVPSIETTLNQGSTSTTVGTSFPQALLFLLPAVQFLSVHSFVLAPTSWLLVGGVWFWRGRVRSRWEGLGFDSDVFRLFMKMKGAKTRLKLLNALGKPKDRYQLAQELGLDWRAVDQHMAVLSEHGLVSNDIAYGRVRMYQLTQSGKRMLRLLEEIDGEVARIPSVKHST